MCAIRHILFQLFNHGSEFQLKWCIRKVEVKPINQTKEKKKTHYSQLDILEWHLNVLRETCFLDESFANFYNHWSVSYKTCEMFCKASIQMITQRRNWLYLMFVWATFMLNSALSHKYAKFLQKFAIVFR